MDEQEDDRPYAEDLCAENDSMRFNLTAYAITQMKRMANDAAFEMDWVSRNSYDEEARKAATNLNLELNNFIKKAAHLKNLADGLAKKRSETIRSSTADE